uniref:Uncharacterized protein n=1 Tax=viral metagenome TaxID=1070528 RepID=A0A6C0LIA9_9ZZZZ
MDINTCEKYDVENLFLEKPKKLEDVYVSNVNFTIQTPKLKINKVSKKITLTLNERMEKLLNDFDNKIIGLLHENSSDFFEEEMTVEDAEEIYKHSFKQSKSESKMSLSINKKLSIFNKHKEQLELDSLSSNDTVICLLKCKKIVFYKSHCEPQWEVFQIKLKEEELKKDKYLFVDDENDNYVENENTDSDELNEIKKIKIKK